VGPTAGKTRAVTRGGVTGHHQRMCAALSRAGAGVVSSSPARARDGGQPVLTAEEREAQVRELLEKLKAASRAPEQATRRVRDLDRMVATLRCGVL
jgi:hypothetical protein